ncbi:amino acid permease, partial [Pseudokineococcus marinus]
AVVDAAGGVPSWLFGLVALVAVANGALLTMVMASRLAYGMAQEGLLPAALGRTLPRRRTPWVAVVVTTALAMALTLVGGLETLASTVVLLLLVVFTSTNAAVLVLRRDEVPHEHFRAPTALPVLALVSVVVLLTQQPARNWLIGGALLALGALVHLLTRTRSGRSTPA